MDTPTPHSDNHERPQLRVLQGGLAAWQEDEPVSALDATRLAAEIAAAARLCEELEQGGLRITFDTDPAGGRVRARVMDDAGQPSRDLALGEVVSPTNLRPLTGAAG